MLTKYVRGKGGVSTLAIDIYITISYIIVVSILLLMLLLLYNKMS